MEILQLWVNLPSRLKMTTPRYVGLQRDAIPVLDRDGVRIQLVSGSYDGATGAFESLIGITMMTVSLAAGSHITLPAPAAHTVFLYVVRGSVNVTGQPTDQFRLVELNADGDSVELEASTDALVLFGHAAPLGEPVVAHGPFVMNTREEIVEAFRDYQMGRFT